MGDRLSSATLARVGAARTPDYDRDAVSCSIVHLGVGSFARAHLASFAEDLLAMGWRAGAVAGVSLRSPAIESALAPQDRLYTVVERGDDTALRVIGSLGSVSTGPVAAIEWIASPTTRLVTLTVTEHGYGLRPGTFDLDEGREDVRHDLAAPSRPCTAPGVVLAGLARRRAAGLAPPVVASLDNLPHNGHRLAAAVRQLGADDPDLTRWIDQEARFPCSVVDRMVPAPMPVDRALVRSLTGLDDHAPVVAEPHRSWVIEAADGLPPLEDVGVEVVAEVDAHERRKLWLLNGPHTAAALAGVLSGHETIAQAIDDPAVADFARRVGEEALEVAALPGSLDGPGFLTAALERFRNPVLSHQCRQVAGDGSQKLPLRILPVVATRLARGLPTTTSALVVATWLAVLAAGERGGAPVQDPRHAAIARGADTAGKLAAGGMGSLPPGFVAEVDVAVRRLQHEGWSALRPCR